MKRLFIHIGAPNAGGEILSQALSNLKLEMLNHNPITHYPLGNVGTEIDHGPFSSALMNLPRTDSHEKWSRLRAEIFDIAADTVILSSSQFRQCLPRKMEGHLNVLGAPFPGTQMVYYIRPIDEWLVAAHARESRGTLRARSFSDFLTDRINYTQKGGSFEAWHTRWVEFFGESLLFRVFAPDLMIGGDIRSDFATITHGDGHPLINQLMSVPVTPDNPTLAELEYIRRAIAMIPEAEEIADVRKAERRAMSIISKAATQSCAESKQLRKFPRAEFGRMAEAWASEAAYIDNVVFGGQDVLSSRLEAAYDSSADQTDIPSLEELLGRETRDINWELTTVAETAVRAAEKVLTTVSAASEG